MVAALALVSLLSAPVWQALAATPADTCQVIQNTVLNGTVIKKYPGVASPDACCSLCSSEAGCTAFTVYAASQECRLMKDLSKMSHTTDGSVTGYTPSASTHYGNPATGCLEDETATLPALMFDHAGTFCSAPCIDNSYCPPDVPPNVTAKPKCLIRDPVGVGMHCGLTCSADAQCGPKGTCSKLYSPGTCLYPTPAPPPPAPPPKDLIQLVYGSKCPQGWKEKVELRGQVIAGAPAASAAGTTNSQPPLALNETGRVGPHAHQVIDPGHVHKTAYWTADNLQGTKDEPKDTHLVKPGAAVAPCLDNPNFQDARHHWKCSQWKQYDCMESTYSYDYPGPKLNKKQLQALVDNCPVACGVCPQDVTNAGLTIPSAASASWPTANDIPATLPASVPGAPGNKPYGHWLHQGNATPVALASTGVTVQPTTSASYPLAYVLACVPV